MKQQRLSTYIVPCLFLFAALTLGGCTKEAATTSSANHAVSADNATTVWTNNFIVQIDQDDWLPCGNGGNGENIHYSGPLHVIIRGTFNDNAGTVHFSQQPQGITGVGSVTGDKYIITTNNEETVTGSFINGRFDDAFVSNVGIHGPGPDANYHGHYTFHYTYNANGEQTVYIDNFTVDCK